MQTYISPRVRVAMLPSGTRLSFGPATGDELATTLALARPVSLCTLADQPLVEAVQQQLDVRVPIAAPAPVITLWPGDLLYLLQHDPDDPQGRVQISRVTAQATSEALPKPGAAAPGEPPPVWVGEFPTLC